MRDKILNFIAILLGFKVAGGEGRKDGYILKYKYIIKGGKDI
jgi:hypothetical protein